MRRVVQAGNNAQQLEPIKSDAGSDIGSCADLRSVGPVPSQPSQDAVELAVCQQQQDDYVSVFPIGNNYVHKL